jgi:predicted MFS family arabinose efflux permease
MSRLRGWATLFVIGTGAFVVSPLLPSIATDLDISEGAAGWTITVYAFAYIVVGPRLGTLADRYGPRTVLATSLGVFAAANVAAGLALNLSVLLLCRALAGGAAAGVTPTVYALVGASAPDDRRATWMAATTSGLLIALAVGAPAGALLSSALGWHGVFVCVGGLAAAVLVVELRHANDCRPAGSRPDASSNAGLPRTISAVSITGLWAVAVYGLYTYLGVGLADSARLSPTATAIGFAVYGAGAVTGNLLGGVMADRHGGRPVTVVSLAALVAAEVLLGGVMHRSPVLLVVVLGLFALAAYPYFTAHQVRLLAGFPDARGAVLAWNNTALYGGILVGSAVGGHLLTATSFSVLAWTLSGAAVIGALATTRAVPDRTRLHASTQARRRRDAGVRCPPG